jgi:hypothetical protein
MGTSEKNFRVQPWGAATWEAPWIRHWYERRAELGEKRFCKKIFRRAEFFAAAPLDCGWRLSSAAEVSTTVAISLAPPLCLRP